MFGQLETCAEHPYLAMNDPSACMHFWMLMQQLHMHQWPLIPWTNIGALLDQYRYMYFTEVKLRSLLLKLQPL